LARRAALATTGSN